MKIRSVKFTAEELQNKEKAEEEVHEVSGTRVELNDEQQAAVDAVVNTQGKKEFLLFGVTGSGKTEVHLRITEQIVKEGGRVL